MTGQWTSLPAMFFEQAEANAKKPLTYTKTDGKWVSRSWGDVADQVLRLAAALRTLGVQNGDRVVLVSENRPEWLVADLAIMTAGAITVPSYTTYTARDYLHILENSGARVGIVSSRQLARTFLKAAHQSDEMGDVVVMEEMKLEQEVNARLHDWSTIIGSATPDKAALKDYTASLGRDDIACLIYTSGTGGAPKGVMLHHGSILHNCEGAREVIRPLGIKNNVFLSFLPLSHAYEHSAGQFLPLSIGAEIWYAEGLDRLATNMAEARPTIMVVVPRLFEMLRTRLMRQIRKEGKLRQKLFDMALSLGTRRIKGEPMFLTERFLDRLLERTVRRKVQKRFGGRLKALVSGGAPLAPDVGHFFAALGLPLLQGYGQTESGPVASVNPPHAPKMHTVGKLLPDTELKIAEDGEILLRGELVMKGYWRDQAATRRTLSDDGWLHTGDVGRQDRDGYLEITDRKKDIIVNDKGDNVSPQRIEGMLALEEEIAQAMIYGDAKPHLVALVVPDTEWMTKWAREHDKPAELGQLAQDSDFHKELDKVVTGVNKSLSNTERVRRFAIAPEPFSIENKQMTPTLKVRRHVVISVYEDILEGMY
ncbi:AMP-dependent synthetase/ligase [Yunchengibacter salinarum]|uniref:AMP-dependent synthetase/ligase n=1 Tax=Yunchengibacter salinarum TaxID=3133399 RepID=UPI0035B58F95